MMHRIFLRPALAGALAFAPARRTTRLADLPSTPALARWPAVPKDRVMLWGEMPIRAMRNFQGCQPRTVVPLLALFLTHCIPLTRFQL